MIVNHEYRFIFLKTRKTAGTSIEIGLSEFCGPDDIITPITDVDEEKRRALGFRGPQNYDVARRFYTGIDTARRYLRRLPKQFANHDTALYVKRNLDPDIWNTYFKFSFERNPFDKAISRYYWSTKEPRPEISDYLDTASVHLLSNWDIYTINDHVGVDFLGRYENLAADLAALTERLRLPGEITMPRAKGGHRSNRKPYQEVLDARARERIEIVCAKEIRHLGYAWDAAPPS